MGMIPSSFPRRRESRGEGDVRPLRLRKGARTSEAQRTDTRAGDAGAGTWQSSIRLTPLRSAKGGRFLAPLGMTWCECEGGMWHVT